MKSGSKRNWLAFAALALAGLGWGLGFPMGKLALAEVGAAPMVLLRFAVAALVALPLVLRNAKTRAVLRSWPVLGSGALYGAGFVLQFEGLARANVSIAALLVGTLPAMVSVAARLMGETVTRLSWIGVAAATAGTVLLAGKPEGAATPAGIAITMASMVVFCGWFFLLKRAPEPPDPLAIPSAMVVVAAVAIAPPILILHGVPRMDLSPVAWSSIFGQAFLSTVIATAAWQYGSMRVSSAAAGVFINIEPMLGAILGVALFGDHAGWPLAVGGLFVLGGSLVVVAGEKSLPPTPA